MGKLSVIISLKSRVITVYNTHLPIKGIYTYCIEVINCILNTIQFNKLLIPQYCINLLYVVASNDNLNLLSE